MGKEKDGLLRELDNERKRSQELDRAVQELSDNRANQEEQMKQLNEELERLNAEVQAFSSAKQELSGARLKEMDLLSKAITNAYDDK